MKNKKSIKTLTCALLCAILCFGTLSICSSASGEKVVRVGYYDSGELMTVSGDSWGGYVYEYLQALSTFTGWKYDYISGSRAELMAQLQDGSIDLLPDVSALDSISSYVSFPEKAMITKEYYLAAAVMPSGEKVSATDIKGKIIGVSSDFEMELLEKWCDGKGVTCESVTYSDPEKKLDDLKNGFIDLAVACEVSAPEWLCSWVYLYSDESYLAVSSTRSDLLNELNAAQKEMGAAVTARLYSKYFSASSTLLTAAEAKWFSSRDCITAGGLLGDAPYTYAGSDGSAEGIMPDVLSEIFSLLDVENEVKWVLYEDTGALHAAAAAGEVDIVAPEYYSYESAEQAGLIVSDPVISSGMSIVFSGKIPDTAGCAIAVPDVPYTRSYVSQVFPEAEISVYSTVSDAVESVLLMTSDCAVALSSQLDDVVSGSYSDSGLSLLVLSDGAEFSFAAPLNSHCAISAVNRGLVSVDSSFISRSFLQHSGGSSASSSTVGSFIVSNIGFVTLLAVLFILLLLALFLLMRALKNRKALTNITEQMSQEASFNGLFLDTYSSAFYINLTTGAYTVYKRSGPESRFMRGSDFSSDIIDYASASVHPDDASALVKAADLTNMRALLTSSGTYTQKYRDISTNPTSYYTLNVIRGNDLFHAAAGMSDVTSETAEEHERREELLIYQKNLEQQLTITNGLSREYHDVWLLTSADMQLHLSRTSDATGSDHFARYWLEHPDYDTAINYFVENFVSETEREAVRHAADFSNLLSESGNTGLYFVTYSRLTADGKNDFQQICFARADDSSGNINYILAFRDVSEIVKEELGREEALRAVNSILEGNMQQELAHKEVLEQIIATRTSELLEKNHALNRINDEIVEMLGDVVELRDHDSGNHVLRVKAFTYVLARQVMTDLPEYGLTDEDVNMFASASALHDVGKILIPDAILLKIGPLTKEEYELMKTHCTQGCNIIRRTPKGWNEKNLQTSLDICRWHHEKWDGRGYPDGLKGDEIPISAQIVSIADCFDALTSKRVYKDAYSPEKAYEMILNGECGVFSEKLLKCFVKCRKLFEKYANNPVSFNDVFASQPNMGVSLKNINVLLVDDNDFTRDINRDILENEGAIITEAESGEEAISIFTASFVHFDVILMDIIMPGIGGIEATRAIRNLEYDNSERIPIIGLTAEASDDQINYCIDAGANACMTKPLILAELTRILLSCMRSLSESMEKKLADTIKVANTDPLTKVYNIAAYSDMVAELTGKIKTAGNETEFAAVMCDINNLKTANDTFGHDIGDVYIINCCRIITSVFSGSPVFRIGGDEFVVILQGNDYNNRVRLLSELHKKVASAEMIPDYPSGRASFAVGMATYTHKIDHSVSDVVKRADSAMYKDKRFSKNNAPFTEASE